MIKVKDLRALGRKYGNVPNLPGVYKWWATKETLLMFMSQINEQDKNTGNNTKCDFDKLLKQIEHYYDDKMSLELYCIYVGKANEVHGLKKRIFGNHIGGNPNGSTFRKTIYSLKYGKNYNNHTDQYKERNKTYVQDVIESLYIEWNAYLEEEEVDVHEIQEINSYLRIFNLDPGDLRDTTFALNGLDVNYRHQVLNNVTYTRTKWNG